MSHPIPDAALDDRLGFVGTTGSGKTYNAGSAVERLLDRGARVVIIDPLDVWWGLRLIADGKSASRYSLPIFGGAHGDLPLNEHAGKLIGETVAAMTESCIVSLGTLGTKAAERRFMLAFLEAIYRKANGEPVHLIFDEADLWAPQKASEPMLQARMEEICRRGRVKGLIPWLITQRPAVISKDVLSQVDGLVAFKLTSSQDRDALEGWIEGQADRAQWKEIRAALPTMERGQGVVWLPGRGVLATASFPAKRTFDSSRTPKRGEKRDTTALKPLDLGALKDRLANVEVEAKANDPAALKAEIARLRKEVAAKGQVLDPEALRAAEQRGFDAGYDRGMREGRALLADAAIERIAPLAEWLKELHATSKQGDGPPKRSVSPIMRSAPAASPVRTSATPKLFAGASGDGDLTRPQRKVLDAIAFWRSIGHDAPTREQIGVVAGYSPSSGGFNNLLGQLRTAGHVDIPQPGRVSLANGYDAAPMSPDTAREIMLNDVLSAPQRKLVLAMDGTQAIDRAELAQSTDYSPTSGGFNNLIGSLTTLGIFVRPAQGQVALSDWAAELLQD